jgi:hypothetical protein
MFFYFLFSQQIKDVFSAKIMEEVRCIVCFEPWDDDLMAIMACGSIVCKVCVNKLSRCPTCNCLSLSTHVVRGICSDLVKNHLRSKQVTCEECEMTMCAFELKLHTQCPQAKTTCFDCNEQVRNAELSLHASSMCRKRLCNCGNCGFEIYFDGLAAHLDTICEEILICCTSINCSQLCARKDLQKHLDSVCPFVVVACPHRLCNSRVQRSDLNSHLQKCKFEPIECNNCKVVLLRCEIFIHVEVCLKKYISCFGCGKKVLRQFLFTHINRHCPNRWLCCTKQKGCSHIIMPGASTNDKKHKCTFSNYASDLKLMFGMIVDLQQGNNDYWTTCLITKTESKKESQQVEIMRFVSNQTVLLPETLPRADITHIAPAWTYSTASVLSPNKYINLPLSLLRECEYVAGQIVVISNNNKSTTVSIGDTNHTTAQYITTVIDSDILTFYQPPTNTPSAIAPFSLVSCEITHVFDEHIRVAFHSKSFWIRKHQLVSFLNVPHSCDLMPGSLYILPHKLQILKFIKTQLQLHVLASEFVFMPISCHKDLMMLAPQSTDTHITLDEVQIRPLLKY